LQKAGTLGIELTCGLIFDFSVDVETIFRLRAPAAISQNGQSLPLFFTMLGVKRS
jgi:hypothetical protein